MVLQDEARGKPGKMRSHAPKSDTRTATEARRGSRAPIVMPAEVTRSVEESILGTKCSGTIAFRF